MLVGKGHPGFHVSVEPNPDPGRAFLAEGQLDYQSTQSTHVVVTDPAGDRTRVPVRIEDSRAPYGGLFSNSNSVVGDLMEAQFGYRVGDSRTPGWNSRVRMFPERSDMLDWTGEGVRP